MAGYCRVKRVFRPDPSTRRSTFCSSGSSPRHVLLDAGQVKRHAPASTATAGRYQNAWQSTPRTELVPAQVIGTAVIIGAGASGLVSALGLAKFGMEVHVYDQDPIARADAGGSTAMVKLTPETITALQSVGINVNGAAFARCVLYSGENRLLDCLTGKPEVVPLPAGELFTTYSLLKSFLLEELKRLTADRVVLHEGYTLLGHESVDVKARMVTLTSLAGQETRGYDLLVGAEGPQSAVRKAILKCDRHLVSQIAFVGPMRYVTATRLPASPTWPQQQCAILTAPPMEALDDAPIVATNGKRAVRASPIVIFGVPPADWGSRDFFKIKLTLFQDPTNEDLYHATFEGTPDLFSELDDVIAQGGHAALLHLLRELFSGLLPSEWLEGVTDAVMTEPFGHSRGATVITNKFSSPDLAPAVAIVGDAAHATSWRLGYSLQTAIASAASLGDSMFKASNLSEALTSLNDQRAEETSALSQIDRLSPIFFGEYAPMGPIRFVIQLALVVRLGVARLTRWLGMTASAPHSSYVAALQGGMSSVDLWKLIRREAAFATSAIVAMIICTMRYFYMLYSNNRYLFS